MDDDYCDQDEDQRYVAVEEIAPGSIFASLRRLQFFYSDMFMRQQAQNLDLVDQFLLRLEQQVLKELIEGERTPIEAYFLGAQSQMWIFAAFEVLRTWDQRIRDLRKLVESGGLSQKIQVLEAASDDYLHLGNSILLAQLIELRDQPSLLDVALKQRKIIHIPYFQLDFIRIALAKHEVKGRCNSKALDPGYGRINMHCGALDYEMENGKYSVGLISRRDIADSLRYLSLEMEPPTDKDLTEFERYMTGRIDVPQCWKS